MKQGKLALILLVLLCVGLAGQTLTASSAITTPESDIMGQQDTVEPVADPNAGPTGEDFFEMIVQQENNATVGVPVQMKLEVYNHFDWEKHVNITVTLYDTNSTDSWIVDHFSTYIDSYNISGVSVWFEFEWNFTVDGFFDVLYEVEDWDTGQVYDEWDWWNVTADHSNEFILYAHQNYYANINEEVWMDLEIYNYYQTDKNVIIEVIAYGNNDSWLIDSFETWVPSSTEYDNGTWFTFYWTFTEGGYYDILFQVTDIELVVTWETWCWWDIYSEFTDCFELWVYQDYTALVGEEVSMSLEVFNYFAESRYVRIEVIAYETSVGTNDSWHIDSFELWIDSFSVMNMSFWYYFNATFWDAGEYNIQFILTDLETGYTWETWCWWFIFWEYDAYEFWIYQNYYSMVGEEVYMGLQFFNLFNETKHVIIEVWIHNADTNESWVQFYEDVYAESFFSHGSIWFDFYYTFNDVGFYEIEFIVIDYDTSISWTEWCWWEITDEIHSDIEMKVYQDFNAVVYEEVRMELEVFNYGNGSRLVYIELIAHDSTGYTWSVAEYVANLESYYVHGNSSWFSFYLTFAASGHYDMEFIVTDYYTYESWTEWCWWDISDGGNEYFEFYIRQNYEVFVGEEAKMTIVVNSFFNHTMYNITVELFVVFPTHEDSIFCVLDTIYAYGSNSYDVYYAFNEPGNYGVYAILTDDIGAEWRADCHWKVIEHTTSGDPTGTNSTDDPGNTGDAPLLSFPWPVLFGAIALMAPVVYRRRR